MNFKVSINLSQTESVCVCIHECAWKQPTDVPHLDLTNKQKVIWVTNTAYSMLLLLLSRFSHVRLYATP